VHHAGCSRSTLSTRRRVAAFGLETDTGRGRTCRDYKLSGTRCKTSTGGSGRGRTENPPTLAVGNFNGSQSPCNLRVHLHPAIKSTPRGHVARNLNLCESPNPWPNGGCKRLTGTPDFSVTQPDLQLESLLMRSTKCPKASFTYSNALGSTPCARRELLKFSRSESHCRCSLPIWLS
jgi:hypothetical protein